MILIFLYTFFIILHLFQCDESNTNLKNRRLKTIILLIDSI